MSSKRKMEQKHQNECEHCDHCKEQKRRKKQGRSWTHSNGHCIELKPPIFDNKTTGEIDNTGFGRGRPGPGWDLHLVIPHATVWVRISSGTMFLLLPADIERLEKFLEDPTKALNLNFLTGPDKTELEIDGSQILLITNNSRISVDILPEFVKDFVQYLFDLTKDKLPKERPKLLFQDKDLAGHGGFSFASDDELGGAFDFGAPDSAQKIYAGGGNIIDDSEVWRK